METLTKIVITNGNPKEDTKMKNEIKKADELKRCPFCGGKAVVEETTVTTKKFPKKSQSEYYVQCVICLTKTKQSVHKHALVDLWNNKGKR